jgi:Recombination endonuclease VII
MCRSCYQVAWTKAHPDANTGNTWAKRNPERHLILKRRQVLRKHGITPEEYDALWDRQGGRCANPGCGNRCPKVLTDYRKGLQVDHCHVTGKVRGLLCGGCNVALGHIKDDARRLAGLIQYLGLN